jgi:hypothetical protein
MPQTKQPPVCRASHLPSQNREHFRPQAHYPESTRDANDGRLACISLLDWTGQEDGAGGRPRIQWKKQPMRADDAACFALAVVVPFMLAMAEPTSAFGQDPNTASCGQAYDKCNDDCIHLGVIKAECFSRCKRRVRMCTLKGSLLPARLNPFRSAEPPAVGAVQ